MLLKTSEEKYKSDLVKISVPFNQSKPIDTDAAKNVKSYLDNIMPSQGSIIASTSIELAGLIDAARMKSTQDAAFSLINKVKSKGSAIVIAHSQGNMLANLAYASIASEMGNETSKMIRVVNVANNSEISVNGLDFTHIDDKALELLENLPIASVFRRSTPACNFLLVCRFVRSPPQFGGASFPGPSTSDIIPDSLHHNFVEVYLSENPLPDVLYPNEIGVTFTQGATHFRDRFEDFVYAAANSLSSSQVGNPISQFSDQFDGSALQSAYWTGVGSISVGNGLANFACAANASTKNKITFSGGKIVVEGGFYGASGPNVIGRTTLMNIVDVASGDLIQFGDTNYSVPGLYGLYYAATGAYYLYQHGNSASTGAYKEYRLTVEGNSLKLERGDTLAAITETVNATLSGSIVGRTFYLQIGSGYLPYCPSTFRWVSVKAY